MWPKHIIRGPSTSYVAGTHLDGREDAHERAAHQHMAERHSKHKTSAPSRLPAVAQDLPTSLSAKPCPPCTWALPVHPRPACSVRPLLAWTPALAVERARAANPAPLPPPLVSERPGPGEPPNPPGTPFSMEPAWGLPCACLAPGCAAFAGVLDAPRFTSCLRTLPLGSLEGWQEQ